MDNKGYYEGDSHEVVNGSSSQEAVRENNRDEDHQDTESSLSLEEDPEGMVYPSFTKTPQILQSNGKGGTVDGSEAVQVGCGCGGAGTVQMKRQIGLFGGIAMIIGTMIGSGIFISPTGVYKRVGGSVSWSLIVWSGCGVLSTLTAITYCELGTVVPRSGGEHAYFQAAFKPRHPFFGEIPSFLFAFITVTLSKPSSLAILSLSVAQYILLPIINALGVREGWDGEANYLVAQKLIAVACACLVAFVNAFSAKVSSQVQIVFTVAKLLACALVIGIGIYQLIIGEFGTLPTNGFDKGKVTAGSLALAFYQGLWSYDELINPNRNLPLAILIGIPLTTFLYVFMNVSYFTVLTSEELWSDDPVGIRFGDVMLGSFSFVIPLLVALSVYGTANGSMFTAGRVSYVAARDGHLVDVLSYVQVNRLTPFVAILLNTFLGIIFISFNDINQLLDSFSIASWIFYSLAMISFFVLRWKEPDAVRPFRVPMVIPVIALLVSMFLVVAPIIDSPGIEHIYPFVFCMIGLCLYYPFVYKKYPVGFMRSVTLFIQRIILVAPSPYKED